MGCSGTSAPEVPTVHVDVDSEWTVQAGSTAYAGHVQYVSKDNVTLTLSSPERVAGMTFHRSGDAYTLSLGSLLCKGGKGSGLLPQETLVRRVLAVLDRLPEMTFPAPVRHEDGTYTFKLPNNEGVSLLTDDTGRVLSMSMT